MKFNVSSVVLHHQPGQNQEPGLLKHIDDGEMGRWGDGEALEVGEKVKGKREKE
jgi:hypothetical protein